MIIFSLAELLLISDFWEYLDNGIHCFLRFVFSLWTSKENVENGRREYIEVGCRKGGEEKEYVRREG